MKVGVFGMERNEERNGDGDGSFKSSGRNGAKNGVITPVHGEPMGDDHA
jgi:hypothetical protein